LLCRIKKIKNIIISVILIKKNYFTLIISTIKSEFKELHYVKLIGGKFNTFEMKIENKLDHADCILDCYCEHVHL